MDLNSENDNNTENEKYTLSEINDVINEELNGMPTQPAARVPHLHHLQQSASSPLFNQLPSTSYDQLPSTSAHAKSKKQKPRIQIVEQPFGKAQRFRYKCEGRSAGSIPGVNSKPDNKTFPAIEIVGYEGEITIVVSCVTKDEPFKAHPHNLVGKENCINGICRVDVKGKNPRVAFSNLGIQCVKRRDIREALEVRERCNVDPFKQKFGHKDQPSSIDLNVVRLAFQAIPAGGQRPLSPVVSAPIYNKKPMFELAINRLCSCSAKVSGGDEIILLCEKVDKNDIKVRFFDDSGWEAFAEFQQTDIHKQTAIAFKTPRYYNTDTTTQAKVFLELLRPSDGETSEPVPFEFFPDPDQIKRKRLSTGGDSKTVFQNELQRWQNLPNSCTQTDLKDISHILNVVTGNNNNNISPPAFLNQIKDEPVYSPLHYGPHRSPLQNPSPSPQPPMSPMIDRNATPSPGLGLMTALQANCQAQMCEMFNQNSSLTNLMTGTSEYAGVGNRNPFAFAGNKENVDTNQLRVVNQITSGNSTNPLMQQLTTSGGSFTPIPTNTEPVATTPVLQSIFEGISGAQFTQQQQQLQEQLQQQQQQQQHLQPELQQEQQYAPNNHIVDDTMATLSDLLRNINSDELLPILENNTGLVENDMDTQ